ncbi:Type-3 glutamine synthetase [Chlamydiales bacterium STE3]|nr:Type-3 glutamine synthetase [Chlamydiales bacterium STE3]
MTFSDSGGAMQFARYKALEESGKRSALACISNDSSNNDFESYVFNRAVMQKMLPKEVYLNVFDAMHSKAEIKHEYADKIALAIKEWAISHGATHYTHWFQPLTGLTAEKHDTFLDWSSNGILIEKFSGKQLIQGEPDASSFPSGGLRSTYEARGYTGWDPTSPIFLWKAGNGFTLCIPSIFFSWKGEVLDTKIPFLRSDKKLREAVLRLLKLTGIQAGQVFATLGLEQEYFVIDRAMRNLRPDLVLMGKTVFGAQPAKGQELQDHYLGSVRDRVLFFMKDFEKEAIKLGIPIKTRHNEVAPSQYEVAPLFEKASQAIDHNLLLMELMRHIAIEHGLTCLLLEKPFAGLNGSGKHSNWSLATNTHINLLDPSNTPGNNLHFLILMAAILHAVHRHAELIRASVGSYSNDARLGGHEAPPSIISVYLGEELEAIFNDIESKGAHDGQRTAFFYDLGLKGLPGLSKDNTDRNRTSPVAFTGNKFELRAVGAAAHPAFPITVLNAIISESLHLMLNEIEHELNGNALRGQEAVMLAAMPVIKKYLMASKPIRFSGDNYSNEWQNEAKRRGLPCISKSLSAFEALKKETTIQVFEGILNKQELFSRYEILKEHYMHMANIEVNLMLEIFQNQILPVAMAHQRNLSDSIVSSLQLLPPTAVQNQLLVLEEFSALLETAIQLKTELKLSRNDAKKLPLERQGEVYLNDVLIRAAALREAVDQLENSVDDALWPLPKYRELLFTL